MFVSLCYVGEAVCFKSYAPQFCLGKVPGKFLLLCSVGVAVCFKSYAQKTVLPGQGKFLGLCSVGVAVCFKSCTPQFCLGKVSS
jgi:hypothetical protein